MPFLPEVTAEIVGQLGAVVATSANLAGGSDPRTLGEVPQEILAAVAVAIDGGELPGTPSTVLDLTAREPVVLRAGAADPAEALARIRSARGIEPLTGSLRRDAGADSSSIGSGWRPSTHSTGSAPPGSTRSILTSLRCSATSSSGSARRSS